MDGVTNEVVDENCLSADAQALVDKPHQLVGAEMVHKQHAADQVETGVAEGETKRAADNEACAVAVWWDKVVRNAAEVRGSLRDQSDFEFEALAEELFPGGVGNIA